MLEYDFTNSIGYWSYIVSHAYQRAVGEEVAPHGITARQCQVLGVLALDGAVSQAEMADRLGVEPPTLVGILDRMERDGWIRRAACPNDRRKKIISATEAAKPVWKKIVQCALRVRERAVVGMQPNEIEQLKNMLDRVHANLNASKAAEVA